MGEIIPNDLPLKFPGRNTDAFPSPWPDRGLPGKGKTPKRNSAQWKAIIDFKESKDWQQGDLQKFANYFGVSHSNLSLKITASLEERRRERVQRGAPIQAYRDDAQLQGQGAPLPQNPPPFPLRAAPDAAESRRSGWEHAARRRRARPPRCPPAATRRCHSPLPSPHPFWLWVCAGGA